MIDKQPFGGPLFIRFGDDVHVLGGDLARRCASRWISDAAAAASQALERIDEDDVEQLTLATPAPSALELVMSRGRVRGTLAMLGPAFVASVAYVDPGNFATNIQAARSSATRSCGSWCSPT